MGDNPYLDENLPLQLHRGWKLLDVLRLDALHQHIPPLLHHDFNDFLLLGRTRMALERDDDRAFSRAALPISPGRRKRIFRHRSTYRTERNLLRQRVPVKHLWLALITIPHVDLNAPAPALQHVLVAVRC